ncbi:MAG TPA: heavy metal translocating P-type ATPase, partial [Cytophagaceae bacterium]
MSNTLEKKTFQVKGMTCASCAVSVESMLGNTKGVKKATVNYGNQTSYVEFDPEVVGSDEFLKVVDSIGYELVPEETYNEAEEEAEKERKYKFAKYKTIAAFALSIPVVIFGMAFHMLTLGNWVSMILSIPVVFYLGKDFFINAFKQAKNLKANMDTLVALSTAIAYLFSAFNTIFPQVLIDQGLHPYVYFEAATVIVAFILLGKLLEERAKTRTSSAIKNLMGLQTKTVKVVRDGVELEIPIEEVQKGEQLVIKPGEKVPVDGKVIEGYSFIDESMISGEPIAVVKLRDSKVFAGTVNQKGSLTILAEKVGNETMLAQIIKTVKQALGSKAPVQKLVDKVAGVFVPVVIAISILTFFAWYFIGGSNYLPQAVLSAVTVLIIACPCALGLATPTAIMVGVGKGAENGILIKDAESLEIAHKVNAIILDKTGTITNGTPSVTDIVWLAGVENKAMLEQIIYSAESKSEHPLADAMVKYFKEKETEIIALDTFESITGKGVKVSANRNTYLIGSPRL